MSFMADAINISVEDVRSAGSVPEAIIRVCGYSDSVSSGVIGMAFSTSGPGPGWSKQHGPDEWSRAAFNGGATSYVNEIDGTMRRAMPVDDDTDENDVLTDIGGCEYTIGRWSAESEVRVACPDFDDLEEYMTEVVEMAQSVIDYHHAKSDLKAWRHLVYRIKAAASAFGDIDPADFNIE